MKQLIKIVMLLTVLFPCERDETTGIIVSNSMTVNLIINLYSTVEQNVKYGEGLSFIRQ
jgi:hypothetical protein